MDVRSVEFGSIADIKLPTLVEVKSDVDNFIAFGLTRSVNIYGEIEFRNGNNGNTILNNGNNTVSDRSNHPNGLPVLEGIIVEAKKDDEIIRVLSDKNGKFDFRNLRPGKWSVKIYENGLSKSYVIEQSEFQFELEPGEKAELKVEMTNRERTIRLIDPPGSISGVNR
jgi:hypothetical protein